jgi:hypothetical protein
MRDYFELCTTTPHDEKCVQSNSPNYSRLSRIEARVLQNQLIRMHGTPPGGAYFKVTSNPHDFGTYHDLAIVYDEDDDEEVDYMLKIESGVPDNWDEIAKQELAEAGYTLEEEED